MNSLARLTGFGNARNFDTAPNFDTARPFGGGGFNFNAFLRIGIIPAVLLASVLVGLRPSLIYLLGVGAVIGGLIFLRWPGLGLVLSLLGGLVVPFNGPSGVNIAMLGVGGLLGLWLADMFIVKRSVKLPPSTLNLPVLANVGAMLLAFAIGQLPWYHAAHAPLDSQLGGIMIYTLSAAAFLLVAHRLREQKWLVVLTFSFVPFGLLYLLSWAVPQIGSYVSWLFQYGSTGSLLFVWLAAVCLGQALYNADLPFPVRVGLAALALFEILVLRWKLGDWKSGWMPVLVTMGALVALRFPRLMPFLLLGIVPSALDVVRSAVATDVYSVDTRFDAWNIIFEIIKANPITGLGPSNYYFYTPLFPIRGYAVNFNSHNQYIDMLAQTGVIGLLAFAWFVWRAWRLGWSLRSRVQGGFAIAYVHSALAGLIGTLVAGVFGDWVLPFVYNVGLYGFRASVLAWLLLGGLVMLEREVAVNSKQVYR